MEHSLKDRILRRPVIHAAAIAVLCLIVYLPSLNAPLVLDDVKSIQENPLVKDLSYFSGSDRPLSKKMRNYLKTRYVGYLSFALNHHFHGLDVRGYHATNLAIHILTALLLYWLVLLTFRTPFMERSPLSPQAPPVALLAALLFALHPVQTQAVTYIVQRLASLTVMFYILSFASYIRARLSQGIKVRVGFYLLSLASALLAMKTKQTAFTLPLAITLYEFLFFRTGWKQRMLWLLPVLLMLAIIPGTIYLPSIKTFDIVNTVRQSAMIASSATNIADIELSRTSYLITESRVLVTYLRLLVLPLNQNLIYDYPVYMTLSSPHVLASVILLALFFCLGGYWFWRSRTGEAANRVLAFGVFFFFLGLSVESSLIPLHPIYEHRLYLPAPAIAMGAAVGLMILLQRISSPRRFRAAAASLITILVLLGGLTMNRNALWSDPVALWKDTAVKSPGHSDVLHNLGYAYRMAGQPQKAREAYSRALALSPTSQDKALTYNNLGSEYYKEGNVQKAAEFFRLALSVEPQNILARLNLGTIYMEQGRLDDAMAEFRKILNANPAHPQTHAALGRAYMLAGQTVKASEHLQEAISLDPALMSAHMGLGELYRASGNINRAIEQYRRALELNPGSASIYMALGNIYRDSGSLDEARISWEMALEADVGNAHALNQLGAYYIYSNDPSLAETYLERAVRAEPGNSEARYNLALTYELLGRNSLAVREYRAFLELAHPGYDPQVVSRAKSRLDALSR